MTILTVTALALCTLFALCSVLSAWWCYACIREAEVIRNEIAGDVEHYWRDRSIADPSFSADPTGNCQCGHEKKPVVTIDRSPADPFVPSIHPTDD